MSAKKKTTSGLTPAAFKKAVTSGTTRPVYIFAGDDPHIRDSALALVRKTCIPEGQEDFALDILHVNNNLSASDVINAAETVPFMGGMRVVWVKHAEDFLTADLDALTEYISEVCETSREDLLLVLAFDVLDKRTRFARTASRHGIIVDCAVRPIKDIPAFVQKQYGKSIDMRAADALQNYVGDDSRAARSELEKVCTYVGNRDTITHEDVLHVCFDSATRNEWAIADYILKGNTGGALRLLEDMRRNKQEPMYAHAIITTALSRLPAARAALADGSIYKRWGEFRVSYRDNTRAALERYLKSLSPEDLSRTLGALMYAEIAVKATQLPRELIADMCCVSAATEKNR